MENRGLLFIPDISGFSRFVNAVELEHSRFIIQQLLDVLLRANDSGLQISEIEGDAILFYHFGEPVDLRALYTQVEKMFRAFHHYLVAYDQLKICQCKACISAVDLTLKVITHYGEFAPLRVQHFEKLIGKDVIVAHQLLKNDIPHHEYWLVTKELHGQPAALTQWMQWHTSSKETESGEIRYSYTQLGPLKHEIPQPSIPQELAQKTKMLSVSRDYDVDIKTLCYTVLHLEFRHLWQVGIHTIDEVEHFLPGIGSRHRYVLENGKTALMYISSFVYDPEGKTIFSETNAKDQSALCFVAEKTGEHTSRLTLELYLPPHMLRQVWFHRWGKKKKAQEFRLSLERLDQVVKDMIVPLEF